MNQPRGSHSRIPRGGPQDYFYTTKNTVGLPTIVRGEGVYVFDDAGQRYFDVISGTMSAALGQGNERVLKAMFDQGKQLTFSYVRNSRHLPNLEAANRIADLAGPGFERVHFSSGGSEAVEMAIKFLRQYEYTFGQHSKTQVITLMPSYHGATLATLGWTGDDDLPAVWGPLSVFGAKIPAPLSYRPPFGVTSEEGARGAAAALEAKILELGPRNVLAFMMEPVGGQSTGANVPHDIFFSEARRICTRHGIYLVFDEIISACRSGTFLAAHQRPYCKPNIAVVAKGLGACYASVGAVLAPAAMVDKLAGATGFNLSHTYNANPIVCAGVAAVMDEIVDRDLIGAASRLGSHLRARLDDMARRSPIIGDVRGAGMMQAIEYVKDKKTKETFSAEIFASDRIRQIGLKHGLILYSRRQNGGRFGEWSVVAPPLVITESEIDEMVDRLEKAIGAFVDEMARAKEI